MRTIVRALVIVGLLMGLAAPAGAAKVKSAEDILVSGEFLGQLGLVQFDGPVPPAPTAPTAACDALSNAWKKAERIQDDFAYEYRGAEAFTYFAQIARIFPGVKGAKKFFQAVNSTSQVECLEAVIIAEYPSFVAAVDDLSVEKVRVKVKGADDAVAYNVAYIVTVIGLEGTSPYPERVQDLFVRYENAVLDITFGSRDPQLFASDIELLLDGIQEAVTRAA